MRFLFIAALILSLPVTHAQAQDAGTSKLIPPNDVYALDQNARRAVISNKRDFICPPCGCTADTSNRHFDHDGICPYCGMHLIEKIDSSTVDVITMHSGSGSFLISGGHERAEKTIPVFYHKPIRFTPQSPILLVIPGAGRNAHEYRDAWISASEQQGVLILSPHFPERDYAFDDYHMGGLVYDTNIEEIVTFSDSTNEAFLDEEAYQYTVQDDRAYWIFDDFDRLFDAVVNTVGSSRTTYDIFGHSAGGQILHRFVLFHPESKAHRVLASNAGFYTLPRFDISLPFGLRDAPADELDVRKSFEKRLVLFLGEKDNQDETGGTLLRSASADQQGKHRFERGLYFYRQAKAQALRSGASFHWSLEVVPNVGHDFLRMSEAAAAYLYEGTE